MSRKGRIDHGRRRFLNQAAGAFGGAALALSSGKKSWYAFADAQQQRQNLVCIHCGGGWDSNWFHNAFPGRYANFDPAQAEEIIKDPTTGTVTGYNVHRYTERALVDAGGKDELIAVNSRKFYGLGLQNASAGDMRRWDQDVCIWRGLDPIGGHGIGNKLTLHGSLSQYAITFSGLIAEGLAIKYGKLPLHYVQTTESPSNFGANWAMAKGSQVPINCADFASLQRLTRKSTDDFGSDKLYGRVNDSVRRLGEEIGKNQLTLRRSKEVYQAFVDNFRGALTIATLGSQIDPFLARWDAYTNYAVARVSELYTLGFRSRVSPKIRIPYDNRLWTKFTFAPESQYEGDLLGYQAAIAAKTGIYGTIRNTAFGFAMADFLISTGLSCVVDIVAPSGDYHSMNDGHLVSLTITYSMLKMLLDSFATPVGNSRLLDRTTVMMFTEFDRSAWLGIDSGSEWRGTEHGSTQSVVLAGGLVKGGQIIGEHKYGPGLDGLTPPFGTSDYSKFGYQRGLPIDFNTGEVTPGGTVPNTMHIFPTMMALFGIDIPAQQITDALPVYGIRKS